MKKLLPLLRLGALLAALLGPAMLFAQTAPAIFVKLSTTQVALDATPATATTTSIAAPGNGWSYSAAAPVAGTTWNLIQRPNPSIGSNSTSTVGDYLCNSASGIALSSATGASTEVTLSLWLSIQDLDSNTTRTEPNSAAGGSTALGPAALMSQCWRIYRGGNGSIHRLSGLPAGANYFLYFYGTTTTTGQGCKFILDAANVPAGSAAYVDVRGGNSGNIYTNDGTNYALTAPAVAGVASTAADNNSWGRLHAVVDASGHLVFRTAKNGANSQYINGYQLMPYPVPIITLPPMENASATVGSGVTLTVAATGEGTLSYQWRKDGSPIPDGASGTGSSYAGTTTPSLTLSGVSAADEGDYDVVVTNPGGSTISSASTLSVTTGAIAPSIVADPASATASTGGGAAFSVSANGTAPLSYRWQKSLDNVSFVDVPGATASALNLSGLTTADAGFYRVVVTNSVGSVTSAVATLTIAPVIGTPPVAALVPSGTAHTLSVLADAGAGSPEPIAYVWKRDGVVVGNGGGVSGATTGSLAVDSFSAAQSGYYTVTVSNSAGAVTSAAVYVGVATTQSVSLAPASLSTGIAIDQQLRLVFPAAPKLGKSGKITLRDAADDSVAATIDLGQFQTFTLFSATVTNAATRSVQGANYYYMPVAVYGNEVWITLGPAQRLAYGKTYYVNMDAAVLLDSTNAAYPGLSGATAWRFSTKAAGPAAPTASTGPDTITVGHDGTGDFATLQGAADWIPQGNTLPRTIRIRPGIYRDNTTFAQNRNLVTVLGEGSSRTGVQLYYPYAALTNPTGAGTLRVESSDLTFRNLTLDNGVYLAQPSSGAPAFAGPINTLYTTGSRLVFDNVLIKGGQDTVYANAGIGYYYNCEIWGSVDFIYGGALAVFDDCDIVQIRNTGGPVCAPSTALAQPYGEVFLNCRFPRALVANGYPYDVGVGTTTFMRPWRQDGATQIVHCKLDTHFSTKAWSEWDSREVTCRAREYGSTMIGGGAAPTPAQRQAAGAYWLNTIDPDYTSGSMLPTDPSLAPSTGTGNRAAATIDPADYTLEAIFGHPYFALGGWLPTVERDVPPAIVTPPASRTVAAGQSVTFTVEASGSPVLTYQWRKGGAPISGQTGASYTISSAQLTDAGSYDCVVTNGAGSAPSAAATLTVLTPFAAWAGDFGLDASAGGFAAADADGDGVANLLEYVLGGDPTAPDSGLLPSVTLVEDVDGKHLVLEYERAVAAAVVDTVVETSADLATWTARTPGVDAEVEVIPFLGLAVNVDTNTAVANNYSGLAAAPGGGTVWNSFMNPGASSGTLTDVKDSDGVTSAVDITIASSGSGFSAWNNPTNGSPNPALLMQDYLFGNTYAVTVGSLPEGSYRLYVYAHGDQDAQTSTVTLAAANGGGTRATAPSGGSAFRDAFAPGAEGTAYVAFSPTVGAAGTLQFSAGAYLNGFQLVQVTNPGFELVRVTIPFTGPRLFARLRATGE